MHFSNMGHDSKKHLELNIGKFFVAYNEFVTGFGYHQPPYTAGVHIFRAWRFAFGWW